MSEHICPSCHCSFKQEFLCTTCGAEKLKDESTRQLERSLHSKTEALMMQTNEIERLRQQLAECERERDDAVAERNSIWESYKECRDSNQELRKEVTRLGKIEDAAVWACESPRWSGDDFYNCMCALDEALKDDSALAKLGADKTGERL